MGVLSRHAISAVAAMLTLQAAHAAPLAEDDTVGSLLAVPEFAGFARRLLPWDDRSPDTALRLRDVARLMPYHSAVEPSEIVRTLNGMQERVRRGEAVFHELYSEAERRSDPDKRHSALVFFAGRKGAPFALIAPGGGFQYVGALHEGLPIAERIAQAGYPAFVLKYRAGRGARAATEDMAQAVAYIRRNADRLGVARDGYSVWGASAGARMAAAIGSYGPEAFGAPDDSRPAAVVMLYTGHSDHGRTEPPTFVAVGENDGIAPPERMNQRIQALRAQGTPTEFHRYPGVGHGFALGTGTSAQGWEQQALRFWLLHLEPQTSKNETSR